MNSATDNKKQPKQNETKQDGRRRAVSLGLGRVKTDIKGGGGEASPT